jgi:hypothetical protein
MQDGRIKDSQITASSFFKSNVNYAPWLGRLHQVPQGHDFGCWSAGSTSIDYLQVDLGTVMNITAVATQGRSLNKYQLVTKYSLQYSTDIVAWNDYDNPQCIKVLLVL